MSEKDNKIELFSESDVEQKFIYDLLTKSEPEGLGYLKHDFVTKKNIRKISIDKGSKKQLYYPDYAIVLDGVPAAIIEAKKPNSDLNEAFREARLYATELNSLYSKKINPCEKIIATDGIDIIVGFWDQDDPEYILKVLDCNPINPAFNDLANFVSKNTLSSSAAKILLSIKSKSRHFKPIFMLGGKSIINETVGENSFGANVSVEFKYLFNPDTLEDREAIIRNAYIKSKRKQSHVAPIDKLIRAATPEHVIDARKVENTENPREIVREIKNHNKIRNQICLLIGSVGSGKSTFTDYLRLEALPDSLKSSTKWINLNLNTAPLSRDRIYEWVLEKSIATIKEQNPEIDFDEIDVIKELYEDELDKVARGKAALFPKDSEKYATVIFSEIERLQSDTKSTLESMINFIYSNNKKLLILVLDNCDKGNVSDQLLMFEVATWLKDNFNCTIFLPLRDTTYDQFKNVPPLDTVIKDLVFRIDPPLLDKVIYKRLNFVTREILKHDSSFIYYLPNGMKVECKYDEVSLYLKAIVHSLFQDNFFRRIISGLAGRNIRKGLEILLDFCKSGHITEDEILKIRQTEGTYAIPNYLISKILLKGKRKYYSDEQSYLKNLFSSDVEDDLPNPFVRLAILLWLKNHFRDFGPNKVRGYHKVSYLLADLQSAGYQAKRVYTEILFLIKAECINSESQDHEIDTEDLISIAPAGFIHLDLLKNIDYLSSVSEDSLFRENQTPIKIAENITGKGTFPKDTRQSNISSSQLFVNYLCGYHEKYFIGPVKILSNSDQEQLVNIDYLQEYVNNVADSDHLYKIEKDYPKGLQIEAQIKTIKEYGIFVEFGLQIGRIHKNQLNSLITLEQIKKNHEEGDWVIVEILGYNFEHEKFSLKLIDI